VSLDRSNKPNRGISGEPLDGFRSLQYKPKGNERGVASYGVIDEKNRKANRRGEKEKGKNRRKTVNYTQERTTWVPQ